MSNLDAHPLIQRWRGFLAKISERLGEIEAESEQGLRGLMEQDPFDSMAYQNALTGLDARVRGLRDKLQSTWDDSVEEKISEAEATNRGILDHALDIKSLYELEFDARWDQFKLRMAVEFYRNLEPHVQAELAQPLRCSQCGSPLTSPDRAVAQSLACPSCGAVNQVAPGKALVAWGGAALAHAQQAVLPLRTDIERFRREVDIAERIKRMRDDYSGEQLPTLERWEQLERNYWTRYAEVLAHHQGKPVDQALIGARMKQFYMYSLESNQVWVRAYGKRSQQM